MAENTASTAGNKRKAGDDETPKRTIRRKFAEAPQFGADSITVVVNIGPYTKVFTAHKDLLEKHSDFFKAAINRNWREAKQRTVCLPEDNPEIFGIFHSFIYSGSIFSEKKEDKLIAGHDAERACLTNCWILGNKLLSVSFKDAIADTLLAKMRDEARSPIGMHRNIYLKSSASSAIRRLLVDIAVRQWTDEAMSFQKHDASHAEFFFDVVLALHKIKWHGIKGLGPVWQGDVCKYHEHGNDKPCYKTMQFSS